MSTTDDLRALLARPGLRVMPCCFDALSAKLIADAGFPLTFMSGFAVSAAKLGLPDTGLVSYGEMLDQARSITAAVKIPVIGDGDTGYGNAMNVKRTVRGYAARRSRLRDDRGPGRAEALRAHEGQARRRARRSDRARARGGRRAGRRRGHPRDGAHRRAAHARLRRGARARESVRGPRRRSRLRRSAASRARRWSVSAAR